MKRVLLTVGATNAVAAAAGARLTAIDARNEQGELHEISSVQGQVYR